MKKKRWVLVVALFAIAIPLFAIVSGQSLTNKLKDLCAELRMTCQQRSKAQQTFDEDYERQHQKMLDVINKSNDLSILLYTQEQNMTFDLTYALKKKSLLNTRTSARTGAHTTSSSRWLFPPWCFSPCRCVSICR